ncbi:hypothetical protein Tco_1024397 [Tanacetum coccineum]
MIQVLGGNYSSTKQVNSIQQLIAYCLITRTKVDIREIIYSDLITRLTNKSRQKYVSYPRFVSCALKELLATKTPPTEEVPTEDSDKTQLVSLGQTAHPQDTERNIQLSVKGFHSLPDEGTRKSQPFSEDKTIDPKDSEGNKHPADKGLPSTVPDESLEVGSIRHIQGLDTAYWGFLGVGTTLDIFQNIHILFLEYGVLSFSGYGVLSFNPLWSLVSAGTDTPYLP